MIISDIMSSPVLTVQMDDSVQKIQDIFERTGFHHLIVKERSRVVGVVSDRDLLKNLSPFIGNSQMERTQDINTLKKRAHQIMRRKLVFVHKETTLMEAAKLLLAEKVTCLPVVDQNHHLHGIVTWRDLLPHCFDCEPAKDNTSEAA